MYVSGFYFSKKFRKQFFLQKGPLFLKQLVFLHRFFRFDLLAKSLVSTHLKLTLKYYAVTCRNIPQNKKFVHWRQLGPHRINPPAHSHSPLPLLLKGPGGRPGPHSAFLPFSPAGCDACVAAGCCRPGPLRTCSTPFALCGCRFVALIGKDAWEDEPGSEA